MTLIVVDASFVAAVLIGSQRTKAALNLLEHWPDYRATAPYVLGLETPWMLLKQERRTREAGLTARAMQAFESFEIELTGAPDQAARRNALSLALKLNMGFFDAMYLALAQETTATLVSRDARLTDVARQLLVPVINVR